MTVPKANPTGILRECKVCFEMTDKFLRGHFPRAKGNGYYVCISCEKTVNYIVPPYLQEYLTLEAARNLIKQVGKIR